jgi:hypothetical protein
MKATIEELNKVRGLDIRVVLIDYRDHPPQDTSYPARLQTGKDPVSIQAFQTALTRLRLGSGGDRAESVLDGIALLGEVNWRPHSRRIAFLVGDAPGHGYASGYGDSWADGCPCGLTAESVSAVLETHGILLNAISLDGAKDTIACFDDYCSYTGGSVITGRGVEGVRKLLEEEFGHMDLDEMVLNSITVNEGAGVDWTSDDVARDLGTTTYDVSMSIRRLLRRDLIPSAV